MSQSYGSHSNLQSLKAEFLFRLCIIDSDAGFVTHKVFPNLHTHWGTRTVLSPELGMSVLSLWLSHCSH